MEVKPGYRQTEVGVFPEDWDSVPLGNFISLQRGHDLTWRDRKDGEVPVVGSAGQNGFHNIAISKGPGVVLGRSGASFGQAHYCEQDFWPHNTALYVTDFQGNDPLFVFYFLRSIDFSRHNSGGAQQSLNRNFIAPIKVGVPRPHEQRVIAEALSDVDGLLGGLDRLIAKKRDLKQAAMQQLLTGQTRLPGFHGEWEVKRLGDIVEKMVGGGTPSRSNPAFWGNEIPWATVKDFATFTPRQTQESITKMGLKHSASHLIPAKTLITSTRMALGKAVFYEVDVAINQDLKALFLRSDTDLGFTYYWFEANAQVIEDLGSGSTVKGISISQLKSIPFPKLSLPEQTAIAEMLKDMDAELAALTERREKTISLKQAMMQELLTGRTRLVTPDNTAVNP